MKTSNKQDKKTSDEGQILKALKEINPKAVSDFLGELGDEGHADESWSKVIWGACGV
jgi:hypothetical protein